ncbi:uncharacterized protein LOC128174681 [Crassostrea angulata]|uniref:uncharacterized protein LOC128174681 n=1 Tax=Magallana angulata TaxID=2784310 RepID=UPI0022B21B5A|nr:uncharacterized protein LOC128174681 [Crassostrea angulata]
MVANLLLEEDVPGAKFVHASVEEHTNIQLKRWLKCRGLPTSGKRPDLIERCQNAVNNNVKIDLKVDDGKWLNLKKNPTPAESQVPYVPIQGWKKFPSVSIPKHFNHGYIYYYLVEVASVERDSNRSDDDCEDDVHTSKPFTKGMNLFRSGHVKNIQDQPGRNAGQLVFCFPPTSFQGNQFREGVKVIERRRLSFVEEM